MLLKQISLQVPHLKKAGMMFSIVLLMTLIACNPEKEQNTVSKTSKLSYRAIHLDDTATLNIIEKNNGFYGQLEINYRGLYKDSGAVNGVFKGDTLMGTFHYQSYGIPQKYRIPIALLKKEDKLIMGIGSMIIKMNMTFFSKNVPIDYKNPKFIFEKMK